MDVVKRLLLLLNLLYAQDWNVRQRFELINLDARFETAINQLELEYDPGAAAFIEHHTYFLQTLIKGDTQSLQTFLQKSPILIEQIKNRKYRYYADFFLAQTHLEQSIIYYWLQQYHKIPPLVKEALRYAQKSKDIEAQRIQALYKILLSCLPQQDQELKKRLPVKADLLKGWDQFQKAHQGSKWLLIENQVIAYFLLKDFLNKKDSAFHLLRNLVAMENPPAAIRYLFAHYYFENHQCDSTLAYLSVYRKDPSHRELLRFPFFSLLLGKSLLCTQHYEESISFFNQYLNQYYGRYWRHEAFYFLALSYLLQKQVKLCERYLRAVTQLPEPITDQDRLALHQARYFLNKGISKRQLQFLQVALLVQSGRFQQALLPLKTMETQFNYLDNEEKTALYFYLGRIAHLQGDTIAAKSYYQRCMRFPATFYLWMHPLAAFYVGQLAEAQKDWAVARQYYRMVFQYQNYPIERSLQRKAMAALERLKNKRYYVPNEKP